MAILDDRGRLFGRVNLIDAAVALVALAIVAAIAVGYALFKLPAAPQVSKVEPATLTAGPDLRLSLRGRNFLPFMRVFIQRTGESARAVHELDPRKGSDEYTLVNALQTQFLVESPSVAEVKLPGDTGPGTYDLVFYNETQQIALKEAAFTVVAGPPGAPPPPTATATVRAFGTFNGLDRETAGVVKPGARFTTSATSDGGEVLSVEPPQTDVARITVGDSVVPASVTGKVQVPAELRLRCSVTGNQCRVGGTALAPNVVVTLVGDGRSYPFTVTEVAPDTSEVTREASVTVRFLGRPETLSLVKAGDVDNRMVRDRSRRFARIESLGQRRQATSRTGFYTMDVGNGQQVFNMDEQVVAVDTVVRVPLTQINAAWFYKGQPIKSGGALIFETPSYAMRGWILSVAPSGGGEPAAARTR